MFKTPALVYKDGVAVARDGRIVAVPTGGVHFIEPAFDRGIEKVLRKHLAAQGSVNPVTQVITHDELCQCCNLGRLLPAACLEVTP